MSRIGKNPITIPANTQISVAEGVLTVKGPLGVITRPVHSMVSVTVEGEAVTVAPLNSSKLARSLWGTFASHLKNMIAGVNKKYEKKLTLEGIGYRVEVQGRNMKFLVGFSHPVILAIPEGIDVVVEKNQITVSGIDKDAVGQFSAVVRAVKKPEPYKGKGIRYDGEYVRRKQGKKASA
ncbi:MAG: 50S ribosomal protein L6 [Candidatus Paceibacterota bacterium]